MVPRTLCGRRVYASTAVVRSSLPDYRSSDTATESPMLLRWWSRSS
ncbi:hypothetical protein A2U01_0078989 [Trifolium medium]|uniref:Uncharacterized protein n=1 Tax=Trifolium medium TaxID=97028 RepID=A0A392T9N1_9FABA|nr:hypothetical protein [Trifolium medium]